jgi:hypothetical protein
MKGCLVAVGILVGIVVLVVVFVLSGFQHIHVRYRVTVEVQDGEQIRMGSSIIDASYDIEPDYVTWSGPNTYVRVEGYAPTVDLGEKGLLFLTFQDAERTVDEMTERNEQWRCVVGDIGCLPSAAYRTPIINRPFSERKTTLEQLLRQSGPREVPFIVLPRLVRFRDVDGGHKLVPVSPNDLAASFGPGLQLKRVTLELANDPITPMPPIWPQWLKESAKRYVGILEG